MRSESWFRERPIRVQRVIAEHLQHGYVDLNLVYMISREIADEPYSESHVFELARALGYLPVGVLQNLLHQAFDFLRQEMEHRRYAALALIERRLEEAVDPDDPRRPWGVTVAEIRAPETVSMASLTRISVMCDALAMAISTPEQHRPRIVY